MSEMFLMDHYLKILHAKTKELAQQLQIPKQLANIYIKAISIYIFYKVMHPSISFLSRLAVTKPLWFSNVRYWID